VLLTRADSSAAGPWLRANGVVKAEPFGYTQAIATVPWNAHSEDLGNDELCDFESAAAGGLV
jgi:hypothetical protein